MLFDSFDDFKRNYRRVYKVKFNMSRRWNVDSTCSCSIFQKNFMCKHLVGLAFYNKLMKCPQEGNGTAISKKKKRGRIAYAKKALEKQ